MMNAPFPEHILPLAGKLLKKADLLGRNPLRDITLLGSDGSDRLFYRVRQEGIASFVVMVSGQSHPSWREEYESARRIGMHLWSRQVPVPAIYAHDDESHGILFEDLGDVHLQSLAKDRSLPKEKCIDLYREAVKVLAHMQTAGREGFTPDSFCWDTPCYDRRVMLEKESLYFLDAYCHGLAKVEGDEEKLLREFHLLTDLASREPADFLLHRDYQSRNLLFHGGRVRVIDFQGARLGPLGYDLASLLIDPYVAMPPDAQEQLLRYYLDTISTYIPLDTSRFLEGYCYLRLQRNLQILGAYANLGYRKEKTFFRRFLRPATYMLRFHLEEVRGGAFPTLRKTVDKIIASKWFQSEFHGDHDMPTQ